MSNNQHPAQDEREAFEVACMAAGLVRPGNYSPDFDLYVSERVQGRYEGFKLGRATRPAQTEQQPIGYTTLGMLEIAKTLPLTGRIGVRCRADERWNVAVYAAPIAQTAPRGETK